MDAVEGGAGFGACGDFVIVFLGSSFVSSFWFSCWISYGLRISTAAARPKIECQR